MPNCTASASGSLPICCAGGEGTFLGGDLEWPVFFEAVFYLLVLLWLFAGVGLISDVFMSAIEAITSQTQDVTRTVDGVARTFRLHVWNDTVANLTLMALGSSAPGSACHPCLQGMSSGQTLTWRHASALCGRFCPRCVRRCLCCCGRRTGSVGAGTVTSC